MGNVTFLSKRASNDSTKLIEAFMVVANEVIAKKFENESASLYKTILEKIVE